MPIKRFYKTLGISRGLTDASAIKLKQILNDEFDRLETETCFYIQSQTELTEADIKKLEWILATPFHEDALTRETTLAETEKSVVVEIGPRLNFSTPFSTNAVSICQSVGLTRVSRIEASVRYAIRFHGDPPSTETEERLVACLHDRMTQCRYKKPIETFDLEVRPDDVYNVDVMGAGREALEKANKELGLAFDEWDLDYYTNLFKEKIGRNPTSVECFDLAQSNSEHSRHWFFRGKLVIDGVEQEDSLFKMIMATQDNTNDNNVIKFNDNSSGIHGYEVMVYKPRDPTEPSPMIEVAKEMRHIIFTAETHNFPTGVAPFPGATTGTGGRIRDVHCTGRGAHVVAGTAGYSFGNLNIPDYKMPWEDETFSYPPNFASPLEIAVEASNGASDYGNKFGEPVLAGFARSFGMEVAAGDRREYVKPIMFSGGMGQLEGSHVLKEIPKKGMEVTKVGGPVYRIGVGGGAASSVQVQGDNKSELDFGAVQRGDAEMEQKLNRLIRACVEMGTNNPILSIHDQGAGGNGNVLKEIVEPAGAVIWASDFQLGDPTLGVLELWGAEYQETNALLVEQGARPLLEKIGNVLKEIVEPTGAVIRASDLQLGDPTLGILELWGAEYRETNAMLVEQGARPLLEKIGNVLKEIVEPAGAVIRASDFQLGDPTLGILELWGAEYQETNALLVEQGARPLLEKIGKRERCPVAFVGTVTGDGKIRLQDFTNKKRTLEEAESQVCKKAKTDEELTNGNTENGSGDATTNGKDCDKPGLTNEIEETSKLDAAGDRKKYPVDLDLEYVLGKMPQKVFKLDHQPMALKPLSLPDNLAVREALERVLRLPSVASKRYLTNKVDRCVTGLVAQQQCVGPLHTPLADVAVTALSHWAREGGATAIGEQPVKGLIDPAAGARMSVGEALTNLVFARVSDLKDVKCSGNWMWPAKLLGEGSALVDACRAMCDVMSQLGVAVDGGKDSLSMAARVGQDTIKAPGTLVISAYVGCPDITQTVTPDLKCPDGKGCLLHVDLGGGNARLGGSALAQCFKQLGDQVPDMDHPDAVAAAFRVTQKLIQERKLQSGHDISDGGLVTCLLEMAFAGNCGINITMETKPDTDVISQLFAEELGLVLEVAEKDVTYVMELYAAENVTCKLIGQSLTNEDKPMELGIVLEVAEKDVAYVTELYTAENVTCKLIGQSMTNENKPRVCVKVGDCLVLEEETAVLRDIWEETSFQLELRQTDPECVRQEKEGMKTRTSPPYKLTFDPDVVHIIPKGFVGKPVPRVAVLREEGSNSDREMAAALTMAGFESWDVSMQDLCAGTITLDTFHGLVFVGGFSYADVLGSAKGWAATALFNPTVREQFQAFKERPETFSLGVCNGCQLMGLLGWVAPDTVESETEEGTNQGVFLDHNDSGRFECRFTSVRVYDTPSIMLQGMQGTVFGMWSAHGEGKMVFKKTEIFNKVTEDNLIPIRYVDDQGETTTVYPHNPNGSPDGVAALCSPDGRHLAVMPHPERCFLPWQCAWMPSKMRQELDASPWLKMFQNAFDWSIQKINQADK